MEERYEIRGKVGQGGLGAVYRGYDTRMNREVAIKRISVANDDPDLMEESTRQLIKEAGALASLQHPHIVTIYDVGSDEDGPYVVMELINGKTLDELIERAPLTWPDFRELAIQTMEGLIAAQELDLIHGDIKPANLMLTWLPSGKFQMKIVDFGLATLTQSQSKEELEGLEEVFGSIYFMAPEQFERVPIDARTDIYAMGCVYYQALTGAYPYLGETSHAVMAAHLNHAVIPIQDLRQGLPTWACEWIMWLLNRMADDRPASAREALLVFLQNDKNPSPALSLGKATAAVRVRPPARLGGGPLLGVQPIGSSASTMTSTAPQPLMPPEGSKPSVHEVLDIPTPSVEIARPLPTRTIVVQAPKNSKSGKKILIALVSITLTAAVGWLLVDRIAKSRASERYGLMLVDAGKSEVKELPMSLAEYNRFLQDAADANTDEKLKANILALNKARPNDNSDFDKATSDFLINTGEILPETRETLIREVLATRTNATTVPALIEFARSTKDLKSAIAILTVIPNFVGDAQFDVFLSIVRFHTDLDLKKAAAECAKAIFTRSSSRSRLTEQIGAVLKDPTNAQTKELLTHIQSSQLGPRTNSPAPVNSIPAAQAPVATPALGAFNPLSLSPVMWLDASDANGLYDELIGGAPVAADGPIARWQDKSGAGHHAMQGGLSARPVKKLGMLNGLPVVRFNGIDQLMGHQYSVVGDATIFMVVRSNQTGSGARVFFSASAANTPLICTIREETNGQWSTLRSEGGHCSGQTLRGAFRLISMVTTGSSGSFSHNGTSTNFTSTGFYTVKDEQRIVGGNPSVPSENAPCDIAEILLFPVALSAADRLSVQQYLNAKWAVY